MASYNFTKKINVFVYHCEDENETLVNQNASLTNIKNIDLNGMKNSQHKCSKGQMLQEVKENCKRRASTEKRPCKRNKVDLDKQNKSFPSTETLHEANRVTETIDITQNDTSRIASNENLLDCLSKNLVLIVEAFVNHRRAYNFYKSRSNNIFAENIRTRFIKIKYAYFEKSEHIVNSMILPRERDLVFVKKFLYKTLLFINKERTTYEWIKRIYLDLIQWAKHRKCCPNHKLPQSSTSQSTVNFQLEKQVSNGCQATLPQHNLLGDNIYNHNISRNPMVNLFSAGPPENEISINIDPKYMPNVTIRPDTQNPINCQFNMQVNQDRCVLLPLVNRNPNCNSKASFNFDARYNTQPPRYGETIQNLNPECNVFHGKTSFIDDSRHHELRRPNDATYASLPPRYEENIQNLNPERNFIYENTPLIDNSHQEELRRSISRDSGFMSPDGFLSTLEKTGDAQGQQNELNVANPFTPKETSNFVNDNSVYAPCTVCKISTNTMCLGCFKFFYCSEACQRADWNQHKHQCKKS